MLLGARVEGEGRVALRMVKVALGSHDIWCRTELPQARPTAHKCEFRALVKAPRMTLRSRSLSSCADREWGARDACCCRRRHSTRASLVRRPSNTARRARGNVAHIDEIPEIS